MIQEMWLQGVEVGLWDVEVGLLDVEVASRKSAIIAIQAGKKKNIQTPKTEYVVLRNHNLVI